MFSNSKTNQFYMLMFAIISIAIVLMMALPPHHKRWVGFVIFLILTISMGLKMRSNPEAAQHLQPPSKEQPPNQTMEKKKITFFEQYCLQKNFSLCSPESPGLLTSSRALQLSKQTSNENWTIAHLFSSKASQPFYFFLYTATPPGKAPLSFPICAYGVPYNLPALTLQEKGDNALLPMPPGERAIYFQSEGFNKGFSVFGKKIFAYEFLAPNVMGFLIDHSKDYPNPVNIETTSKLICIYYRQGLSQCESYSPQDLDKLIEIGSKICQMMPPIIEDKYTRIS